MKTLARCKRLLGISILKMSILMLVLITSCFQKQNNNAFCDKNCYSEQLKKYCVDFQPSNLNLDSSIKQNIELNIFLDTVDEKCLQNQKLYKLFI
jgi:hypothetical protein